jgi:hypothetical protein
MEGRVLGIPLVIIMLVLGIAFLVDVPMLYFHFSNQSHLRDLKSQVTVLQRDLALPAVASVSATPTATPSGSPTAIKTFSKTVTPKPASNGGELR